MAQLNYNLYQGAAYAGLLYDIEWHRIVSACAEDAIPFGRAVIPGTDAEKQVKLPSGDVAQVFRGIAAATWAQEQVSGVGQYSDTDAVNIMKQGVIWVEVNQNVLVDEAAFFNITGGTFRKDVNGGLAEAVPTGVFRSSANSGELALLEINLP